MHDLFLIMRSEFFDDWTFISSTLRDSRSGRSSELEYLSHGEYIDNVPKSSLGWLARTSATDSDI